MFCIEKKFSAKTAKFSFALLQFVIKFTGIYKHMLSDKKFGLTHNLLATKVMPPLIPHTVNPGLSMEKVRMLPIANERLCRPKFFTSAPQYWQQ